MQNNSQSTIKKPSNLDSFTPVGECQLNQTPGMLYGVLRRERFPEIEEIIHCLSRGFVGMLVASTNVGKSTLVRNLLISLCIGRPFAPLVLSQTKRRVALIDCEDSLDTLKKDLQIMSSDLSEQDISTLDENLFVICDEQDSVDLRLSLSDPNHFKAIVERLKMFRPDLIIVDTISSAFIIQDENNNAEVNEHVMSKLRSLARLTKAAVLALHHSGKASAEFGAIRELSHRGRGASAFGDQSRVILNLDRDSKTNEIVLRCGKSKGEPFTSTVFRLDKSLRWFEKTGELDWKSDFDSWLGALDDGRTYTTSELLAGARSDSTGYRDINTACRAGYLKKVSRGKYEKLSNCQRL